MYIIKSFDKLSIYGFKEYGKGFSKKLPFGFLDISFQDSIVKKVHFNGELFIYEDETGENIHDLIKANMVKEIVNEEKKKKKSIL